MAFLISFLLKINVYLLLCYFYISLHFSRHPDNLSRLQRQDDLLGVKISMRACGVLRKLVNVVGRNLWRSLSLTERKPGGLIKKKPDKNRFHRETIRAISPEYLSRDYFEGGRRRVWKRDRFGVRETRQDAFARRSTAGLQVKPQWSINNRLQSLKQGVASAFTLVFLFCFFLLFRLLFLCSSYLLRNGTNKITRTCLCKCLYCLYILVKGEEREKMFTFTLHLLIY